MSLESDTDHEYKSVGHVDGDDEADNLCGIEASLELTQTSPTGNTDVTSTTYYEKDVDIEELLCDTPEPANLELITEASVDNSTDELDSLEMLNRIFVKEKKSLEELKEKIRTGLRLILECLRNTKSNLDELETISINQRWTEDKLPLTSEASKVPEQIREWEQEHLKQEYQTWIGMCKNLEERPKWDDYKEIFDNYWEDYEEEDIKIIQECECLGVLMETQRVKISETGEEYFRKVGVNI